MKVIENQPTFAEQLEMQREQENQDQLERGAFELQQAEYPTGEVPSTNDYK